MNKIFFAILLASLLIVGCSTEPLQSENVANELETSGQEKAKEQKSTKEGENITVKVLLVVASKDFRDEEFQESYDALTKEGCEVTVASSKIGELSSMKGKSKANATILVKDVKADDYHIIVFVGGAGAKEYFDDEAALKLAKDAFEKDKYVAAICIAPSILANAGILKNQMATCFKSETENLEKGGAVVAGDFKVITSGKITTANGPEVSERFAKELLKLVDVIRDPSKSIHDSNRTFKSDEDDSEDSPLNNYSTEISFVGDKKNDDKEKVKKDEEEDEENDYEDIEKLLDELEDDLLDDDDDEILDDFPEDDDDEDDGDDEDEDDDDDDDDDD